MNGRILREVPLAVNFRYHTLASIDVRSETQ
jgi:hypothetical protein